MKSSQGSRRKTSDCAATVLRAACRGEGRGSHLSQRSPRTYREGGSALVHHWLIHRLIHVSVLVRRPSRRCRRFLAVCVCVHCNFCSTHTLKSQQWRSRERRLHAAPPQHGLISWLPGKALPRTSPNKRPLLQTDSPLPSPLSLPPHQCPKVFAEVNLPKSCTAWPGREGVPIIPLLNQKEEKKVLGEEKKGNWNPYHMII